MSTIRFRSARLFGTLDRHRPFDDPEPRPQRTPPRSGDASRNRAMLLHAQPPLRPARQGQAAPRQSPCRSGPLSGTHIMFRQTIRPVRWSPALRPRRAAHSGFPEPPPLRSSHAAELDRPNCRPRCSASDPRRGSPTRGICPGRREVLEASTPKRRVFLSPLYELQRDFISNIYA